jgi:Protein of unknown function (DUF3727)
MLQRLRTTAPILLCLAFLSFRGIPSCAFVGVVVVAPSQRRFSAAATVRNEGATVGALSAASSAAAAAADRNGENLSLRSIPPELEDITIPFLDPTVQASPSRSGNAGVIPFIDCYADSIATVNGVTYTIGVPCDCAVALCYSSSGSISDGGGQLIPIEVTDTEMMDDLFPVAEAVVREDFGDELVLQRTPQTLTLVGELELIEDEDDDEDDDNEDDEDEEEEVVDLLLSFEHRGKEYHLVRLLDPVLLVGKEPEAAAAAATTTTTTNDSNNKGMETRVLLTPEESDRVMPILEDLFLKYYDADDEDDADAYDDVGRGSTDGDFSIEP